MQLLKVSSHQWLEFGELLGAGAVRTVARWMHTLERPQARRQGVNICGIMEIVHRSFEVLWRKAAWRKSAGLVDKQKALSHPAIRYRQGPSRDGIGEPGQIGGSPYQSRSCPTKLCSQTWNFIRQLRDIAGAKTMVGKELWPVAAP